MGEIVCKNEEPSQLYPAISACIAEARQPRRAEFMLVARRITREAFPATGSAGVSRFGVYRRALRAARAALGVEAVASASATEHE